MTQKNLILLLGAVVILTGITGCSLFKKQTNSNVSSKQNIALANENNNVNKVSVPANTNVKTNSDINDLIINAVPVNKVIELLDDGGVIKDWELVSGDPNDTCTTPTYNGEVKIHGWYVWETNYGEKEWLLHLDSDDIEKLPISLWENEDFATPFLKSPYLKIKDASAELEEELKNSSEEQPMALTIKGFRTYCEGYPQVSLVEYSENSNW